MRLTELAPSWIGYSDTGVILGLSFKCPHCLTQRLAVAFANPIDPKGWAENLRERYGPCNIEPMRTLNDGATWQRAGDTFDTLSLVPSVDCSKTGHWHGNIINGEIISP